MEVICLTSSILSNYTAIKGKLHLVVMMKESYVHYLNVVDCIWNTVGWLWELSLYLEVIYLTSGILRNYTVIYGTVFTYKQLINRVYETKYTIFSTSTDIWNIHLEYIITSTVGYKIFYKNTLKQAIYDIVDRICFWTLKLGGNPIYSSTDWTVSGVIY